ncbi:MAG: hypothetical protein FAF05_00975 [Epsilonproteobacteria bacterium]|nr:hypothetical protein [Campylobacterota bacterium]
MKQVDPLHIAALLITFALFLGYNVSLKKQQLQEAKQEYKKLEMMAIDLAALKKIYANKNKTQSAINRILRQPSLKTASITKKITKNAMVLQSKKIGVVQLNSLFGKLFNSSYNIKQFTIKRIDDDTASLTLEIAL